MGREKRGMGTEAKRGLEAWEDGKRRKKIILGWGFKK